MDARCTVLGSGNVDGRGIKMNLLPADAHKLADPQRMPERHQDKQSIADRIAAVAGGGEKTIDLALRQVLALSIVSVLCPTAANCRRMIR